MAPRTLTNSKAYGGGLRVFLPRRGLASGLLTVASRFEDSDLGFRVGGSRTENSLGPRGTSGFRVQGRTADRVLRLLGVGALDLGFRVTRRI